MEVKQISLDEEMKTNLLPATVVAQLKNESYAYFGAFDGDELVGIAVWTFKNGRDKKAILNYVQIAHEHQRKHFGTELIRESESRIKITGMEHFETDMLVPFEENAVGNCFLKSLGYGMVSFDRSVSVYVMDQLKKTRLIRDKNAVAAFSKYITKTSAKDMSRKFSKDGLSGFAEAKMASNDTAVSWIEPVKGTDKKGTAFVISALMASLINDIIAEAPEADTLTIWTESENETAAIAELFGEPEVDATEFRYIKFAK